MISFKQYITELFDNPLKWKEFIKSPRARKAEFRVGDFGYIITIEIGDKGIAQRMGEKVAASIEFGLADEKGVSKDGRQNKHKILNTGNAGLVFSTVIDYAKYVIKQEGIGKVIFTGWEPSRQKLYWKLMKRFSGSIFKGGVERKGSRFVGHIDKIK